MLLPLLLWLAADNSAEGMKALDAKDYPAAAEWFKKGVAEDPKDYAAHFHLALAYSLMAKDAEAIAEYRTVLELKPALYEASLNLGILLLGQKQAAAATPLLAGAAEQKPKEFRPRLYLGDAWLDAGDPAKAEESYKIALELKADAAAAHLGLARAIARQKRLAEAVPHFRKAAELDPTYKDALLELAVLHEEAGQVDEAAALYRQFPENAGAKEHLATLYFRAKRFGDSIAELEAVVARDPTTPNRLALASAYRLNKEPLKAIPVLEQAIAADPRNFEARMVLGTMLRDQKKYQPAAQQFFGATQIQPESKEAWNELAGMLILLEDFPRALAALDKVKALGGEIPAHHFFRAIILDKTKQYELALAAYEKFLAVAGGKFPDEEFQARQRVRIIKKELSRR